MAMNPATAYAYFVSGRKRSSSIKLQYFIESGAATPAFIAVARATVAIRWARWRQAKRLARGPTRRCCRPPSAT